jgi:S1-C subfamily serine protease
MAEDYVGEREQWKVKIPGGAKTFESFELVQIYCRKLMEKGLNPKWISRVKVAQNESNNKMQIIASSLAQTFKIESVDLDNAVMESGSTFCIAPNKFITCAHVIKRYDKNTELPLDFESVASSVEISVTKDAIKHPARLIAIDGVLDIALLEIDIECEPFKLATGLAIGEEILTVGSPHGFENNVTFGDISSLDRKIYFYEGAPEYLFIDASVFSGNSGGPIVKVSDGTIVGLLTAIVGKSTEYGLNAGLATKYLEKFLIINKVDFQNQS